MGNLVPCAALQQQRLVPSKHVVKLVHRNGLVEEFHRPVRVGELTVDYPHHFICNSKNLSFMCSTASCEMPPILSEEEDMEIGMVYFLLPTQMLNSLLTQADIAALVSKAAAGTRKSSYKGSQLSLKRKSSRSQLFPASPPDHEELKPALHCMQVTPSAAAKHVVQSSSRQLVHLELKETDRLQLQNMWFKAPCDSTNSGTAQSKQLCGNGSELQTAFTNHRLANDCSARLWEPSLETITEANSPTMAGTNSEFTLPSLAKPCNQLQYNFL